MSEMQFGYALALASLCLFSSAILLTRAAARHIDVSNGFLIATGVNVVFAGLVYLVDLSMREKGVSWNWHGFLMFGLGGVFSTYFGRWFFYESVLKFGPARASVFQISSPLFTALIAWVVLSESLTPTTVFGMLLTMGGLLMVSHQPRTVVATPQSRDMADRIARKTLGQRASDSLLMVGLASACAYAIGNVFKGVGVRSWDEPILGGMLGALFGMALHVGFAKKKSELWGRLRGVSKRGFWIYVAIGVCGISAQICAIGSMRHISLAISTLVTLCTPLLVIPLSHVLFKNDRPMGPTMLVGSVITMAGIYLVVHR